MHLCMPLCSLRFLLFSASTTNRVPATGIDDLSQEENRIGSVIANQKHERVIGPENDRLRFHGDCRRPDARSRPLQRLCTSFGGRDRMR